MKKFLIGLMGMVFVLGLAFGQTQAQNFEKATQTELAKRNDFLQQKAERISVFHIHMANDAIISGKEMRLLDKMVADFNEAKKKFDKELEFFRVKTEASIPDAVLKHLDIYFYSKGDQNPTDFNDNCDNKTRDIRRWFVEKTGYDIRIEMTKYYFDRIIIGIVMGIILCLFSMIVAANIDKVSKDKVIIIIGSAVFTAILALFLFVL